MLEKKWKGWVREKLGKEKGKKVARDKTGERKGKTEEN